MRNDIYPYLCETKRKNMKQEFKIYKQGVTDSMVIILSKNGEPFNRIDKIKKYIMLGYDVYDLNNNKINF